MLSQFCSRYPQGSLISELVQIFHGRYIVRVSVIIEGQTLTGLAAADTVETAEDLARLRALALLNTNDSPAPVTEAKPQPEELPTPVTAKKSPPEKPPSLPPNPPAPVVETPPPFTLVSELPSEAETIVEEVLMPQVAPPDIKEELFPPAPSEESPPPTPETTPVVSEGEGMDFNQVMAQIDLEMKRLQWTKEQGRDYLRSTYGKTSRIQLNDTEIIEFLTYLKTQ